MSVCFPRKGLIKETSMYPPFCGEDDSDGSSSLGKNGQGRAAKWWAPRCSSMVSLDLDKKRHFFHRLWGCLLHMMLFSNKDLVLFDVSHCVCLFRRLLSSLDVYESRYT
ncbi:unnamed protein product [Boreogadus saida]